MKTWGVESLFTWMNVDIEINRILPAYFHADEHEKMLDNVILIDIALIRIDREVEYEENMLGLLCQKSEPSTNTTRKRMPVITRFYGILIKMYFREHGKPHFTRSTANIMAYLTLKRWR